MNTIKIKYLSDDIEKLNKISVQSFVLLQEKLATA